ncbi:MAG: helix-turn-helix domain-containing protein [Candidatus Eisenbacteria bacterium]
MTSLTKALRAEMRAAARDESKQAVETLRAEIQAIRKSITMLERRLLTGAAPGSRTRAAAAGKVADNRRARFSPALMRKHREALGMSRKAYARLLGVSSLSIYLWEVGRTRPRRKTVLAWQDLRKKGARALRAMAGVVAPRRAAGKKRARRAVTKKRVPRATAKKRAPRATAKKRAPRAAKKRTRRVVAKRMSRAKAA